MHRRLAAIVGLAVAIALLYGPAPSLTLGLHLAAQSADDPNNRLAGLQWRFVRIKYHYSAEDTNFDQDYYGEPWLIDGPAAEQNLSRRLKTATAIEVEDPIVLTLEDPKLFEHPWIYMVEPGNLKLNEAEARNLREFLLRGGTLTFDDFHGPIEFEHMANEMKKVFPERQIVDLPNDHPVFSCFYRLSEYPQVPGLGSYLSGRTWEKGGFNARLRTILDDDGRPMLFINWNTDMGDGWEWSNAEEYPDYIQYTSLAYRMGINEIVYALTH